MQTLTGKYITHMFHVVGFWKIQQILYSDRAINNDNLKQEETLSYIDELLSKCKTTPYYYCPF